MPHALLRTPIPWAMLRRVVRSLLPVLLPWSAVRAWSRRPLDVLRPAAILLALLAGAGACSSDRVVGPPASASPDPARQSARAFGLDAPATRYGNLVAQAQGCLFELAAPDGRVQRVAVPYGSLPFDLPRVQWQQRPRPGETGPAAMRVATMSLGSAGQTRSVRVVCVVPRAVTAAAFGRLVRVRALAGHAAAQQDDRSRRIVAQLARATPVSRVPTTAVSAAAARIRQQLLGATPAARHAQRRQILLQRSAAAPLVRADAIALRPPRPRVNAYATLHATGYSVPTRRRAGSWPTVRAGRLAKQLGSFVVRPTCEEDPGDPEDPGDDGERLTPGVLGSGRPIVGIGGAKPECGGDSDPGDPGDPGDPDDPGDPGDPYDPGNPNQDCGNDQGCSCDEVGDCDYDWDYYDQLDINCGNGWSVTGVVDSATDAFTPAADADPNDFAELPDDLDDDENLASTAIGCTATGRTACLAPGEATNDPAVRAATDGVYNLSVASAPNSPWNQVEYGVWLFRRADGSIYAGQPIRGVLDHICMVMGPTGGANVGPGQCVGNPPPGAIGEIHSHPTDGNMTPGDQWNGVNRHMVMEVVTPTRIIYYNGNTRQQIEVLRKTASTDGSGVNGDGTAACE